MRLNVRVAWNARSKYLRAASERSGNAIFNDGTGYLDLAATYDLGGGWGVNGHVGHLSYKGRDKADYTDWKVGVTKDVKGYVFGLAYVGTNARDKAGDWYSYTNASTGKVVAAGADTVLVSVSKTF